MNAITGKNPQRPSKFASGTAVVVAGAMFADNQSRSGVSRLGDGYPKAESQGLLPVAFGESIDAVVMAVPYYMVELPGQAAVAEEVASEPVATGLRSAASPAKTIEDKSKLWTLPLEHPVFQGGQTQEDLAALNPHTFQALVYNLRTLMTDPSEAISMAIKSELCETTTPVRAYKALKAFEARAAAEVAKTMDLIARPAVEEVLRDLKFQVPDAVAVRFIYQSPEEPGQESRMADLELGLADEDMPDGIYWSDKNGHLSLLDPFQDFQPILQELGARLVSRDTRELIFTMRAPS